MRRGARKRKEEGFKTAHLEVNILSLQLSSGLSGARDSDRLRSTVKEAVHTEET